MSSLNRTIFRMLALAMLVVFPQFAGAVSVVVGNVQYEIIEREGPFDDFETELTDTNLTPWWGDQGLAETFSQAYLDQNGAPARNIRFVYRDFLFGSTPAIEYRRLDTAGNQITFLSFQTTPWVFVTTDGNPIVIPEINGASLSQLVFILLVLSLGVAARRSRGSDS